MRERVYWADPRSRSGERVCPTLREDRLVRLYLESQHLCYKKLNIIERTINANHFQGDFGERLEYLRKTLAPSPSCCTRGMMQRLALISVSDKSGLLPFAKALVEELDFRILSTGGTARLLRENGIDAVDVSDHTGFPEMMDGRVKTLHPKIHGGLLCLRNNEEHRQAAEANDIEMIELVVVNLYPFEETVAKPGVTLAEAIEQIDIGGPSMLRSAAKNNRDVTVVCDPGDYDRALDSLKADDEAALLALRSELALKVYRRTSEYDGAISEYLGFLVTLGLFVIGWGGAARLIIVLMRLIFKFCTQQTAGIVGDTAQKLLEFLLCLSVALAIFSRLGLRDGFPCDIFLSLLFLQGRVFLGKFICV